METLTNAISSKQNVALTILHGLERSRLLLRCSFALLAKQPSYKFYHVLDSDQAVRRVQHEASLMPFRELGPEGAQTRLVICSLMNVFKYAQAASRKRSDLVVLILDVSSLDTLEELLIDLGNMRGNPMNLLWGLSRSLAPTSIVLGCNGPLEGLEPELGHSFPITLTNSPHQVGTFASIVTSGPSGVPMVFGGPNQKKPKRKVEKARRVDVGAALESLVGHVSSGGVVVLFQSYDKMVEYYDGWASKGVFKRAGLPHGRETQTSKGGDVKDSSRRCLQELATKDKSIFLCSVKYQIDEDLAETVFGRVRLVIFVGLPYPEMSETWKTRIKGHNKEFVKLQKKASSSSKAGMLGGNQLFKYRALDHMNGLIKKCLLNRFRSESCDFLILDQELGATDREKLAKELGDVQVETFKEAFARYSSMRMAQPIGRATRNKRCAIM